MIYDRAQGPGLEPEDLQACGSTGKRRLSAMGWTQSSPAANWPRLLRALRSRSPVRSTERAMPRRRWRLRSLGPPRRRGDVQALQPAMVLALGAKAPGACRRRRTRPLPGQDCHGNGGGLIAAPLFLLSRVPATTGTLNVLVLAGQNLAELLEAPSIGEQLMYQVTIGRLWNRSENCQV
jgi:hypothetical protein